jgi:hypothetical protein
VSVLQVSWTLNSSECYGKLKQHQANGVMRSQLAHCGSGAMAAQSIQAGEGLA